VFAPVHGVPEDPATGSSNGCLAAYLAREQYGGSPDVEVRVEQGYELDRPSLLLLRASDASGGSYADGHGDERPSGTIDIDVRVGGRVIPVANGELV
jgi:trans-2,3-dihydro-3-hydroxyanthranilate isomerase